MPVSKLNHGALLSTTFNFANECMVLGMLVGSREYKSVSPYKMGFCDNRNNAKKKNFFVAFYRSVTLPNR